MSNTFRRIAIVNRGEPAMRLIHAVREFNREHDAQLRTIALFTEPDAHALFVREADEAYDLGSATFIDPRDGERKVRYLDYATLERALRETRAEAVWVGWGFVSERADFVELCDRLGVVFIGPSAEVMRKLGDKITSKKLAEQAGVPVAPWSDGPVDTLEEAREHAGRLGYPLMIKATAGGGGRGIRVVRSEADLAGALDSARAEALNGFGDPTVFMEAMVGGAHHIEVQIISDGDNCWAVGVRDCTLQRRHQKVLEETPSPILTKEQDAEVRAAAVRLATLVGYRNAGTVEFLYDKQTRQFAFMEVNTRLQVEHPVTELTTGLDLVKLQILVAQGHRFEGDPPPQVGHAIELRLNAEDPDNAFAPAPGHVEVFRIPTGPGVRIDTGVEEGDEVAPQFDSMIAKVMAYGRNRAEALARLQRVLGGSAVALRGGMSNKGFLMNLLDNPDVQAVDYDIGYLDRLVAAGKHITTRHAEIALIQAAIEVYGGELAVERSRFFALASRGRPEVSGEHGRTIELGYRGNSYTLEVYRLGPTEYQVAVDGRRIAVRAEARGAFERQIHVGGQHFRIFTLVHGITHMVKVNGIPHQISLDQGGAVRSPAPAVVVSVNVAEGDRVAVGDRLVVLEAMKMELSVLADFAGTVREVSVRNNVQVTTGAPLLFIEPDAETSATVRTDRIAFDHLGVPEANGADLHAACKRNLDEVKALMLGYDVDPGEVRRLLAERGMFCEGLPADDPLMLAGEDEVLNIFADVGSLFQRQRAEDEPGEDARRSTEDYLFTYLRDLDAAGHALPAGFIETLKRVLSHYGVESLDRTPELEESLFRIATAHQRTEQQVTAVLSILERRRNEMTTLASRLDDRFRVLLDRLVTVTQGIFPAINDVAREVRYRYFSQPLLAEARRQAYREAEWNLAYLEQQPDGDDRDARMQALVDCPQPLKSLLSSRFWTADPRVQRLLLQIMMRRYYRIRDLEQVHSVTIGDHCFVTAEYEHQGKRIHVVTTHADYERLAEAAGVFARFIERYPAEDDVVVDFYAWKNNPIGDEDAAAEELRRVISSTTTLRQLRRVVVSVSSPETVFTAGGTRHFTFRPSPSGYWEENVYGGVMHRGMHPMMAKRLNLWRFANFNVERLPSADDVYLLRATARENPADERLFGIAEIRDLTPVRDASGRVVQLPYLERMFNEVLEEMRHVQSRRPARQRLFWNRLLLYVWPPLSLRSDEFTALVRRLEPLTEGVGLESVTVHVNLRHPRTGALRETVVTLWNVPGGGFGVRFDEPENEPLQPLGEYEQKVLGLKQRGLPYPYELIRMMTTRQEDGVHLLPPGEFREWDLDERNELVPVERPFGKNRSNIVTGVIRNFTPKYPEGMERVILLGDPTRGMGNLAEPECRRINAALELALRKGVPCEWFALSGGAKIAMDSGVENMDWIALTLRRIVEYTQAGGELNIVSMGINVGAQPYWNAEATMLMHTRGVLIMTPDAAMVLTGKQALDYSGGVSAEDNFGIGGYDRIMGPNGQAQYGARDIADACRILLRYYDHSYAAPGERFPRRADTADSLGRDVCAYPHGRVNGTHFDTLGDVFSEEKNAGRKKAFDIRKVMRAVTDQDHEPLERWFAMQDAEIGVVWDAHVGGYPVCMIGLESRPIPRLGFIPADGPDGWTGGTLFPRSSKKVARAVNAASGNRPLVVLANLSGFDGSPESMRSWQLEYGAEIGRAVVNFRGPIVFVVVSRYHGGAFVVFSNRLNDNMEVAALEGSYASVIGGAPAAAVVFARDVKARTQGDPRLKEMEAEIGRAQGADKVRLQARARELYEEVHAEKLGQVADEFDHVHSVHRAQQVGSVHRIIPASDLRPYVIDALERGIRREMERLIAAREAGASRTGAAEAMRPTPGTRPWFEIPAEIASDKQAAPAAPAPARPEG